jgi:hypothetical protein
MDTITLLIGMFTLHFIGDFVFQSKIMANNKSKSIYYLTSHVLCYCAAFIPIFLLIGGNTAYVEFMVVLFTTHWITDFITSKITSYFWKKKQIKAFFTTIGLDQLIHTVTLLFLYKYLVEPLVFI